MLPRAVDVHIVQRGLEAGAQVVTKTAQICGFGVHLPLGNLASLAEADDAGNIERTGAHTALMAAAVDLRGDLHARIAAAHIESAHALGAINFVAGDRGNVNVVVDNVERRLADNLHGVAVEDDALLVADFANLADGLQDTDFVVGGHDGDQDGLVVDGTLQVVDVDEAVGLHRQIGDAIAVLLQALAGVEYSLVLGDLGDDVVAALAVHLRNALDGEVVALGGAGGEDDLLGGGADELGDLCARGFNGLFGLPAKAVIAAGRIAKLACEIRHHRFQHAGVERRGGVIVHVDRQHNAGRHFNVACNCAHPLTPILLSLPDGWGSRS